MIEQHHFISAEASDIEDYIIIGISIVATMFAEILFPFQDLGFFLSGIIFCGIAVCTFMIAFVFLWNLEFNTRLNRPLLKIGALWHKLKVRS
jgi:hypothetical protein